MAKKCFTTETRLSPRQFSMAYFEKDIEKQSQVFRVVWKMIQTTDLTQSRLNSHLQAGFCVDKRTANSIIQTAKGRLKAIKELKKVERSNLETRISTMRLTIGKLASDIKELKPKVTANKATEKQLAKYRRLKKNLWNRKQKLNRMRQQLANDIRQEEKDYYPVCWGTKKGFKAQYHLEENGFKSHEGWRNEFRRRRDTQVNFVGSVGEPKGNQNCQLSYNKEDDCFQLKIRKDLEFMKDDRDKFFYIYNLKFQLHKDELIRAIKEGKTPFCFRFLRRGRKWYLQVIFTWVTDEMERKSRDAAYGAIGLDFNDGFISFSETDLYGNLKGQRHFKMKYHGTGNKADSEIQEILAEITSIAEEKEKPIVMEDLSFRKKKAQTSKSYSKNGKQYNKMLHALDYSRYKERMENACFRHNIELIYVNPAYTSQIGEEKFGSRMKLNRHQAASYVIARKGQGYVDKLKRYRKPKSQKQIQKVC